MAILEAQKVYKGKSAKWPDRRIRFSEKFSWLTG
jgi:hypothetical protein